MQLVSGGPDIPENLIRAHEEGRVIFFCGAGISYPAGLPGFRELVDGIYQQTGTARSKEEAQWYRARQYDRTLYLLEQRIAGGQSEVREKLAKILQPNLKRKNAIDTHQALLELSKRKSGAIQLVTTNFDRLFCKVAEAGQTPIHAAPTLPLPKNSQWNSIVHLHGLLPGSGNNGLSSLVLTSADFGRAYLTERWAASFVSELARNYIICFVGYSINDPVLRYMMDALAADRQLGEAVSSSYIFVGGNPGIARNHWQMSGIEPIFYNVLKGRNSHRLLHATLRKWASTYRDGITGKLAIVDRYARSRPGVSTANDDFVGRMLWALTDLSGEPAKHFAKYVPAPPLDWLKVFSERRYGIEDLPSFGLSAKLEDISEDEKKPDSNKLRFSLVDRPAPFLLAPRMALACGIQQEPQWDKIMIWIGHWLLRHLHDPKLVLWLTERGGVLHSRLRDRIELELASTTTLGQKPDPFLSKIWQLWLAGSIKNNSTALPPLGFHHWISVFKRDGLTVPLRQKLRRLLQPMIAISRPFSFGDVQEQSSDTDTKAQIDCELVLCDDHVHSTLKGELDNLPEWKAALPELVDDVEHLLRYALDLMKFVGKATDKEDLSLISMPSIQDHRQNRGYTDWVSLIHILRDAWLAVYEKEPPRAQQRAISWFFLPYLSFKRLALFAASQDGAISPEIWTEWLSDEDGWWLWAPMTMREVMRLLVLQGSQLDDATATKLEQAILRGPPRDMYRKDVSAEKWDRITARSIWLRLAKLNRGRGNLGPDAYARFHELSTTNPAWKLADNERDEFTYWTSGTFDPDFQSYIEFSPAPERLKPLVVWLKRDHGEHDDFREDNWEELCSQRFHLTLAALYVLAKSNIYPEAYWQRAIDVWANSEQLSRSWKFLPKIFAHMPEATLREISHAVARWLEKIVQTELPEIWGDEIAGREKVIALSQRLIECAGYASVDPDNPVFDAINDPVGITAESLLNIWFKHQPKSGEGLPSDLKPVFTELCDWPRRATGCLVLCMQLPPLFQVDEEWVKEHLLPLFSWHVDEDRAVSVWQAFLWGPRLYWPLLTTLKRDFLEAASHFAKLGEAASNYVTLLTQMALEPSGGYTHTDFRTAFGAFSNEALPDAAEAVGSALSAAGDERRPAYFENRVKPFWHNVWPKDQDRITPELSRELVFLTISAGANFPEAVEMVKRQLSPIKFTGHLMRELRHSGFAKDHTKATLALLSKVLDNRSIFDNDLAHILDDMVTKNSNVEQNLEYQNLRVISLHTR